MDVAELARPPSDVVFLSGAGVSSDGPTCLPLGNSLTKRALRHAFWNVDPERVAAVFRTAGMPGGYPRLETVLGAAFEAHGEPVLRYLLADVVTAPPNDLHRFFARHLAAGGAHVTANVDSGIEQAAVALGLSIQDPWLVHFHGIALPESDLSQLGLTLSAVERGFRPEVTEALNDLLLSGEPRTLVVLGYSGLDYFDMGRYLRQLSNGAALQGWTVVWIDHGDRNEELHHVPLPPTSTALGDTLQALAEAGAQCRLVKGWTRSAVAQLARQWNLPCEEPVPCPDAGRWCPDPNPLPDDQRRFATVRLCDRLGLVEDLRQLVRQFPALLDRDTADAIAMANWEAGRFGAAKSAWRNAWDRSTTEGRLRIEERRAACDWQRGRYLRALRRLERALDAMPADCDLVTKLVLADTLARLLEHMSRWPDVRRFVTPNRRARALQMLPTPEELQDAGLGQDLVSRAAAGRSKLLEGQAGARYGQEVNALAHEWHAQTSSVLRTLAYEHGQLRGLATLDDAARHRYLTLRSARKTVGMANLGTATLPFAIDAFGIWPVIKDLWSFTVGVTPWHRVRLTVGVVGRAARSRLSKRSASDTGRGAVHE